MARYQAILFDVDGTLIHSSPGILETMAFTFQEMGVDVSSIDLHRYLGPPLRRTFGEHFSDPALVEKAVTIYRDRYKTHGQFGCSLYPGVKEMLDRLRQADILLYTATSKPREVALPILEYLGIADRFTYVGGASIDASLDTKTAVMRHVLARPELEGRRVLMVGDRKEDLQGAADCGLDAAGALYGYGGEAELAPFAPVFYAGSCRQLADWILNENTEEKGVCIEK